MNHKHISKRHGASGFSSHQGVLVLASKLSQHHNELDLGDVLVAQAMVRQSGTWEDISANSNTCKQGPQLSATVHPSSSGCQAPDALMQALRSFSSRIEVYDLHKARQWCEKGHCTSHWTCRLTLRQSQQILACAGCRRQYFPACLLCLLCGMRQPAIQIMRGQQQPLYSVK